jgi:hypothetical protein
MRLVKTTTEAKDPPRAATTIRGQISIELPDGDAGDFFEHCRRLEAILILIRRRYPQATLTFGEPGPAPSPAYAPPRAWSAGLTGGPPD